MVVRVTKRETRRMLEEWFGANLDGRKAVIKAAIVSTSQACVGALK